MKYKVNKNDKYAFGKERSPCSTDCEKEQKPTQ